jgi:hypothetical protein
MCCRKLKSINSTFNFKSYFITRLLLIRKSYQRDDWQIGLVHSMFTFMLMVKMLVVMFCSLGEGSVLGLAVPLATLPRLPGAPL